MKVERAPDHFLPHHTHKNDLVLWPTIGKTYHECQQHEIRLLDSSFSSKQMQTRKAKDQRLPLRHTADICPKMCTRPVEELLHIFENEEPMEHGHASQLFHDKF